MIATLAGALVPALVALGLQAAPQSRGTPPAPPPAAPPTTPLWSVTAPPGRLVLVANRGTSLLLTTNTRAAHHVRIAHTTLQDAATGRLVGVEALSLCLVTPGGCVAPDSLAAGRVHTLMLRVADSFTSAGTFVGGVVITADETTEPSTISLTIASTTVCNRLWGLLALAVGVLASWFVTVFARNRMLRDERMLPARALAEALATADKKASEAETDLGTKLDGLRAEIRTTADKLTTQALARYLPRPLASPFGQPAEVAAGYTVEIASCEKKTALLAYLAHHGIAAVRKRWDNPAQRAAATKALADFDQQAGTLASLDDARKLVAQHIAAMDAAAIPANVLHGAGPAAAAAPPPEPTVEQLQVRMMQLSGVLWLVWGLLTVGFGWFAVVYSNDGFGTMLDYAKALGWGLGMQAAGGQLQQLAPTSVTTALSVTLPK